MELKAGQYVRHAKYGWGTIMDHDREQTLVCFRRIGIKRLQAGSATFVAIGGEASKRKPPVVTGTGRASGRSGSGR
ncbi:MAG TPA: hypothetical protein VG860_14715 [Terriglobia bacterium]|jgi:hypothetical protein|nr:hypothetical protein [Terriglobia bacterium]